MNIYRRNLQIQNHIWWKRKPYAHNHLVDRTKRGRDIARRAMMRKFPYHFTVHSLHSEGITKRGKPMKGYRRGQKCKCKHCGYLNGFRDRW